MCPQRPSRSIGFLHENVLSDEQSAAMSWLKERDDFDTSGVQLERIADGTARLEAYDALWWHRENRNPKESISTQSSLGDALVDYVESGGGLLLTHLAVAALDVIGFDPSTPDRIETGSRSRESGFLVNPVYEDHPIFAGFSDIEILTESRGYRTSSARYSGAGHARPASGDVLAMEQRTDNGTKLPLGEHDNMAVAISQWRRRSGWVLGIGQHLSFGTSSTNSYHDHVSRLVSNCLSFLADPESVPEGSAAIPDTSESMTEMRKATDLRDGGRHRPRYHFAPPANWFNDPQAMCRWNGQFHLFYLYNSAGPIHGGYTFPRSKGHAVSDDLVHWEDRPVAIEPTFGGPDQNSCQTGSTVTTDTEALHLYTGGGPGGDSLPCLARSRDDNLDDWEKDPDNPVIPAPPADVDILETDDLVSFEYRDPWVWESDGEWYAIVGAGITDVGGTALLYRSDDMRTWEYLNPILTGTEAETGDIWEVPVLFDVDGDTVLVFSDNEGAVNAFVGTFDGRRFNPDETAEIGYGDFYAPQVTTDREGRTLLLGWLPAAVEEETLWKTGWSGGALSLPRQVTLDDGVAFTPAPAVAELRDELTEYPPLTLDAETRPQLELAGATATEVQATFDLVDNAEFGICLRRSPTGDEATTLHYDQDSAQLVLNRRDSTLRSDLAMDDLTMPLEPTDSGTISLRLFLDRSIVEVYVNEQKCLTGRIYPTRSDSEGIHLYAERGVVDIRGVRQWSLESAYSSRAD